MPDLPINLDDLLRQRTVEGERIEYKAGWNPAPKRSIDKLLELKRIEFTVPDTPRSPNQKLRLPASKDVR